MIAKNSSSGPGMVTMIYDGGFTPDARREIELVLADQATVILFGQEIGIRGAV